MPQSKGYQPPVGWPMQQLSSLADQQNQVDKVIKILKRVLATPCAIWSINMDTQIFQVTLYRAVNTVYM